MLSGSTTKMRPSDAITRDLLRIAWLSECSRACEVPACSGGSPFGTMAMTISERYRVGRR